MNSVQQQLVVIETFTQLSFHVICVPQLCPQHPNALICGRHPRSLPHTSFWICNLGNPFQHSQNSPPEFQTCVFPPCTRMRACLHNSRSAPPYAYCKPSGLVEMYTSSRNAINRSPSARVVPRQTKGASTDPLVRPLRPVRSGAQCRRHSPTGTWKVAHRTV